MQKLKNFQYYLIAPILSVAIFAVLFQLWNVDFSKPFFDYDGDTPFSLFLVKNVITAGWFVSTDQVGLSKFSGNFSLYDFPIYADSFHFFVIKIFSYFSSNPFLILNCFFVFTFALISATSFIALRSFDISNFTAILISILFAFTPYHFYRSVSHISLSNYAIIPLSVMVAIWIMQDKIQMISVNKKRQFCFGINRYFVAALLIACFAAVNGIYYAFYSCVIFMFAWFLRGLRNGFFDRKIFDILTLCLAVILLLLAIYMPSFIYWSRNGFNQYIATRGFAESELYALRIIDLFLPVENHYIEYFRDLHNLFYSEILFFERAGESLGILGCAGFLFLIFWLIVKDNSEKKSFFQRTIKKFSLQKNDKDLISNLSNLNLLLILFATAGGLIMFVALSFSMFRSHARMSIFITFISLLMIAIIFDKIIEKKKFAAKIFISIIFVLALLDQVGQVSKQTIQSDEMTKKFLVDKNFVQKIEANMPSKSMIFEMPINDFPESPFGYDLLVGYLHSKDLRWSYPAIKGRESSIWQNKIAKLDFDNFISEIREAGFVGVYIDRRIFATKYSWNDLRKLESFLRNNSKSSFSSEDLGLVFFDISKN